MTTASSVNGNPAESIYSSLGTRTEQKTSALKSDEDRFLKLLTTQLKNQDPLNPMDNAQMTSQLAQISTVDGIEKLNASLQTLLSQLGDSQAVEAAGLVNRGVLVPGSKMAVGEQGGIGGVELGKAVDEATVTIKDGNGLVMRTLNLGALNAGIHPFVWDGKTDSGVQVASGTYSYGITTKTGAQTATATTLAYGQVQAVTRNNSGLTLDVGTLGAFTMADVKQIL